jgi:hypothetical protein
MGNIATRAWREYAPRNPGIQGEISSGNFQRLSLAHRASANGITVIGREHESVPAKSKSIFSGEEGT